MNTDFVKRVLDATAFDHCDDIWWRTDTEYAPITFFVNCNDLFFWGSADCEELTPDNIELFEQSYRDADEAMKHGNVYASLLFCARVRAERPQGAYYKYLHEDIYHLFDACGPEREVGIGNPHPHPNSK